MKEAFGFLFFCAKLFSVGLRGSRKKQTGAFAHFENRTALFCESHAAFLRVTLRACFVYFCIANLRGPLVRELEWDEQETDEVG